MTADKATKKAVRERMAATGENYTTARRQMTGQAPRHAYRNYTDRLYRPPVRGVPDLGCAVGVGDGGALLQVPIDQTHVLWVSGAAWKVVTPILLQAIHNNSVDDIYVDLLSGDVEPNPYRGLRECAHVGHFLDRESASPNTSFLVFNWFTYLTRESLEGHEQMVDRYGVAPRTLRETRALPRLDGDPDWWGPHPWHDAFDRFMVFACADAVFDSKFGAETKEAFTAWLSLPVPARGATVVVSDSHDIASMCPPDTSCAHVIVGDDGLIAVHSPDRQPAAGYTFDLAAPTGGTDDYRNETKGLPRWGIDQDEDRGLHEFDDLGSLWRERWRDAAVAAGVDLPVPTFVIEVDGRGNPGIGDGKTLAAFQVADGHTWREYVDVFPYLLEHIGAGTIGPFPQRDADGKNIPAPTPTPSSWSPTPRLAHNGHCRSSWKKPATTSTGI